MDAPIPNPKYSSTGIAQTGPSMNKSPVSNPGVVYQPANKPTNPGALKIAQQTKENIIWKAKNGGTVNIGTISTSPATTAGSAGIEITDANGNLIIFFGDASPVAIEIDGGPNRDTPIPLLSISDGSLQEDAAISIAASNESDAIDIDQEGNGYGIDVESNVNWNWLGTWSSLTTYTIGDAVIDNLNSLGYRSITAGNLNHQPSTDGGVHWTLTGNKEGLLVHYQGAHNVVTINNINSANGNSPLQVATSAVFNSHFRKEINLNGIHVYVSDGTNPNTHLTAEIGAVCLNSSGTGQIAYNTNGSTAWTLL